MKKTKKYTTQGFSIIEVLIVITILIILAAIVLPMVNIAREKAYYAKSQSQFKSFVESLELYKNDHKNLFPADANRNIPAGLEEYLTGDGWPDGPWPGSIYDWDNWNDPDNPGQKIYQISVRFCPASGTINDCRFPNTTWASDFGINSALYYCIQGACRSHINEDIDYPGRCVNCE